MPPTMAPIEMTKPDWVEPVVVVSMVVVPVAVVVELVVEQEQEMMVQQVVVLLSVVAAVAVVAVPHSPVVVPLPVRNVVNSSSSVVAIDDSHARCLLIVHANHHCPSVSRCCLSIRPRRCVANLQ